MISSVRRLLRGMGRLPIAGDARVPGRRARPSRRVRRLLKTALALVAICAPGSPAALGKDRQERPFGGPPPPSEAANRATRSMAGEKGKPEQTGSTCRTANATCDLSRPLAIGAACACPSTSGRKSRGRVH